MEAATKSSNGIKNGTINDRPLFMQNGNRRFSISAGDPQEISNFRQALPQFLAVSVKNILLFVYGMTLGFPTIVIPAIQGGDGREPSDIVLNKEQISWFSSINLICVPMGCLFSGMLTQPIGKRRAMQIVNLPILASWLLFHFSTRTEHLYAALCLSGLGGGLMEAPVLTYVAEITEPKYRGILSALGSTCVITGVFIQFIMGSLMDWRTIAAVSSAFPVISIISLCFIPESPTWLIREHRFREAIKSLQWLRGWVPEYKIEEEFNRLYNELITQPAMEDQAELDQMQGKKPGYFHRFLVFRKRSFLAPFLLVAFTFFVGHFSGKTSLQTYAVQIFHTLKAPINKYHATILLGMAEMVATVLCVFLIHFTGKRPLVLISTIGVGICLFGTATYAHYLRVVPGFAVNNVVVNASSIVPKDSIITRDNITQIFESEEKALLLKTPGTQHTLEELTTILPEMAYNRTARDVATLEPYNITFADEDDLDLEDLGKSNFTESITEEILDLEDSEEVTKETTTLFDDLTTISTSTQSTTTSTTTESPLPISPASEEPKKSLPEKVKEELLLTVPKQEMNNLVWIPLILLLGAAFFAHLGIRMIPWILIGEVFPATVRSTASGLVSGLGYIFGFLANKLFLQMLSLLTMPGTFWFYSAVAFVGCVTLYFTLPETEGRTLGEIEAHFSKKSPTNLLCKKQQKLEKQQKKQNESEGGCFSFPLQVEHLDNLQIPIGPYTEAKIIQLQQSDFLPNRRSNGTNNGGTTSEGVANMAYEEESNTTHL
ncbi:facilitated trehalose transporter Tret1 isoform X2 [Musca domestica]|uniref:Facilitated trehalose transporter Tret1 isoform X2 n=1 Tax=Musca domestica TaxID=7370 RepID=A0A1I8M8T8_MUSDO|nr:facilitated trehalose transporter Tret1 isoform X2 [Musca domestica]XP_011292200.1 facilitated trehalose transporter Tret1 isoform X2 [Musca domestica]